MKLDRHGGRHRPSKQAQVARWTLRGLMIAFILIMAIQQGFAGLRLAGVVLAIVWALCLPVVMTWVWRVTRTQPSWRRALWTGAMAVLLIVAFAVGIRPLLGP